MKPAPSLIALLAMVAGLTLAAAPARAQTATQLGLEGALRGCESWVLNPASWVNGPAPFIAEVNLGDKFGQVNAAMPQAQPPEALRVGNQYWGINAAPEGGLFLVLSDRLPMCHITAGGPADLQPAVEVVIASEAFLTRWQYASETARDGIVTTQFQHRASPLFGIAISRADAAGGRTDRAQIVATALMELEE